MCERKIEIRSVCRDFPPNDVSMLSSKGPDASSSGSGARAIPQQTSRHTLGSLWGSGISITRSGLQFNHTESIDDLPFLSWASCFFWCFVGDSLSSDNDLQSLGPPLDSNLLILLYSSKARSCSKQSVLLDCVCCILKEDPSLRRISSLHSSVHSSASWKNKNNWWGSSLGFCCCCCCVCCCVVVVQQTVRIPLDCHCHCYCYCLLSLCFFASLLLSFGFAGSLN